MKKMIKKASKIIAKASSKRFKKTVESVQTISLNKQYLKTVPACNVTFRLPKQAVPDAKTVAIVGDFNNWNLNETRMKKLKNGDFKTTLKLNRDREYKFRYLIDNNRWENDWVADKYVPNVYGDDDSVVIV